MINYDDYVCPLCGCRGLFAIESYSTYWDNFPNLSLTSGGVTTSISMDMQDNPTRLACRNCYWRGPMGIGEQGALEAAKDQLDEALVKAIAETL